MPDLVKEIKIMEEKIKLKFTELLMQWHFQSNDRKMPWKGEKDPYKIWLSEVILQQTRVEQGWNYYERFVTTYPTVQQLAAAEDEAVFKLWEGLGYYNRCRNLLFTARYITKELKGKFPDAYDEIVALKGVGPYTAAAISSFAFNLPYAVVDGNVFRVLARVFGIDQAIDSTAGKQVFSALAEEVLDKKNAAAYNQAIMDFGATVCKPLGALCNHCPMQKICVAYNTGTVNSLPVKEKVLKRKSRWLYYFMFEADGEILVHKRNRKDIWENLFEFYLLESQEQLKWNEKNVVVWLKEQLGITRADIMQLSPLLSQQLTHQKISGQLIKIRLSKVPVTLQHYNWQPKAKLQELAFPKFIRQFLEGHY
jgi:A/G-specific adenine glycosylase